MTTNPRIEAAARAMHEAAVRDVYCDETPRSLKSVWVDGDVDFYELATAALAAADAAAWRPISEAPRDGTEVLVYAPEREGLPPLTCGCSYHPDGGWCVDELRFVTHWQPLPRPPQPDAEVG